MTVLVVLLYSGAVVCAVLEWRARLRMRRVTARPTVTCAEIADVVPGTAVVLAGRTAGGPGREAPLSGHPCVWYEVVRRRTVVISSNSEETTETVDEQWGDCRVYDEDGAGVRVTTELGRRSLIGTRLPMVVSHVPDRPGDRDSASDYERIHEYLVEPDRALVVVGVVELDDETGTRRLGKGSWADGCVQAHLDEVPRLSAAQHRWTVAALLVLTVAAVMTTAISAF